MSASSPGAAPNVAAPPPKMTKTAHAHKVISGVIHGVSQFVRRWTKFAAALVVSAASGWVSYDLFTKYDGWHAGLALLGIGIVCTLVPLVYSFMSFGKLNPPGVWFDEAAGLSAEQSERLMAHYSRIEGTLRYWKNTAAAYRRLHNSRVIWSLISAVALPVLIQRYDRLNPWSATFMTVFTTWTGLLVSLAYTLKAEEKYQGHRQQESDFYDASRTFLDAVAPIPATNSAEVDKLISEYVDRVAAVRKVARRVETSSPPSAF